MESAVPVHLEVTLQWSHKEHQRLALVEAYRASLFLLSNPVPALGKAHEVHENERMC